MAKGRKYKCPICEVYDYEDSMVVEKIGGQNKRIHKVDCYRKYEQEKEFKKKEREELDELVEVIKETHDIGIIPNQFFSHLQDIRNGNELFGKVGQKKSKDGYTYKVIAETYKDCQDSINWAKANKDFKNAMGMLLYTKAIIKDNVWKVAAREENKKNVQEQYQMDENKDVERFEHIARQPKKYKKKKKNVDVSKFMD